MGKGERIGLWVVVGLLALWLLVLTVMTAGEFAAINRYLRGETEGVAAAPAPGEPTPWWGGSSSGEETAPDGSEGRTWNTPPDLPEGVRVGVAGVRILSDTVAMTVTVRSSGAGDLLYEPPVVVDGEGRVYPVTPDSLERARLAFLDLVTRGQAEAELVFSGTPPEGARLTLVFNPHQQPEDIIAPRVEVGVPVAMEEER